MRTKPQTAIRVLFVDDDSATRAGYTKFLAHFGYQVMPAATGQEALTLASTCSPDVIVLDLGLARHRRVGGGAAVKSGSTDSDNTDHRFDGCGPSA